LAIKVHLVEGTGFRQESVGRSSAAQERVLDASEKPAMLVLLA
jgi:hypothetical protein